MPVRSTILPCRTSTLQALICCLLLFAAGCETAGLRDDPARLEDRAKQQTEAGNYRAAAQTFERLASRGGSSRRNEHLLNAAGAWYLAGERSRAMHNMRSIRQPFPDDLKPAQQLMAAAVEVERGQARAALNRLRALPENSPRGISSDALAVGAQAWFALGEPDRAVSALMERELWLDQASAILENQRRIWEGLRGAGKIVVADTADPVLAGWLELGNAVANTAGDPLAERAALLSWRSSWPKHPANSVLLADLLDHSGVLRIPERVALLLPQSGRLESAGAALRDGFIAAYFDYGDAIGQMEIVVYDTAELGATEAYRLANEDGADFVVGPLQKSDVADVAELAPAGPTTLALNYLPTEGRTPKNFYQYALAPEHEAVIIAQHAIAAGNFNAVALVPSGDWGERLLDAFATELNNLGGRLLAHNIYEPNATDFSSVIRPVLHLDRSYSRSRALASFIAQPIEFEPRRRQDVDFVFVAAQPRQARLIRPQLRFHYATTLPAYATAAAFSPDADLNRDINGLIIAATPWEISPDPETEALRSTINRFWPGRAQHRSPLYAMGYDAWRLIPLLTSAGENVLTLSGVTGELSLLENGRIMRAPMLAQIVAGIPAALQDDSEQSDAEDADDEPSTEKILPGGSGSP